MWRKLVQWITGDYTVHVYIHPLIPRVAFSITRVVVDIDLVGALRAAYFTFRGSRVESIEHIPTRNP